MATTRQGLRRNENARAAQLLEAAQTNNTNNNSSIKCELYFFNGWTTYTRSNGRGRVQTENIPNPGIRLKFRSAPVGTTRRIFKIYKSPVHHEGLPIEEFDYKWINKQYKEIRRSVLNKLQVVIGGHSHGGLLSVIFAEMLDQDITIPDEKLENLYVVTFNAIQIIPRTRLNRIKLLYQFANTDDVAQAIRRSGISNVFNISKNRTNNNVNMFDPEIWNSSQYIYNKTVIPMKIGIPFGNNPNYRPLSTNLHVTFDRNVSKVYYNKRYSMLWLWKSVPKTKEELKRYLAKTETGGKTVGLYVRDPLRFAHNVKSHVDYPRDKFVDAVIDMFKRRIQLGALNMV